MDILKASKKLKEIKVDAYNNLSSGEEESELQLESSTEMPNEDSAAGEEVKPDRPKAEKVKEYKTLSRTNPMDGNKTRAKEEVYMTDATLKAPTSQEIWNKLQDLKKRSTPESIDEDTASMLSGFKQSTDRKLYEDARDGFMDVFEELSRIDEEAYGDVLYETEDIKEMLKAVEILRGVFYDSVRFKGRGMVLKLLNSLGELE